MDWTFDFLRTAAMLAASCPLLFVLTTCCCQGCVQWFTDDYSTDQIATSYTTVSGTWTVGSGVLTTSSSNALLVVNNGASDQDVRVNMRIKSSASGDELRLLFHYVDANNHSFAAFVFGANLVGGVRIGRVEGGTEIMSRSAGGGLATATNHDVIVRYKGDVRTIVIDTSKGKVQIPAVGSGTQMAIQTKTVSGTVTLDNLVFEHADCADFLDQSCAWSYDDFNRAASTDLGSVWDEVSGSWETDTGSSTPKLLCTSAGKILTRAEQPDGEGVMQVSFQLLMKATDDKVRVLVDYVDADNHHYLEIVCGFQKQWRWVKRAGGSDTVLGVFDTPTGFVANVQREIVVCISEYALVGPYPTTPSHQVGYLTTPHGGAKAGIEVVTLNGANIDIRGWEAQRVVAADQESCLDCYPCTMDRAAGECRQMPSVMKAVISGVAAGTCGDCSSLNGTFLCDWAPNAGTSSARAAPLCFYQSATFTPPCVGYSTRMVAQFNSANPMEAFVTQSVAYISGEVMTFADSAIDAPDCVSLVDESLPRTSVNFECDGSSATCLLTSL